MAIIYNVGRQFFAMKADADAARKLAGLKPDALLTLTVEGRADICALLNALCEPQRHPMPHVGLLIPERLELVERAYVEPSKDVPDFIPRFLLDDEGKKAWDARQAARFEARRN